MQDSKSAVVIIAHPKPGSITHSIADAFCSALQKGGIRPLIHDLYLERFNPVLEGSEIEGWPENRLSKEVATYQAELRNACGLTLIFPVWWNTYPAILSGWLQRVLTEGFAFGEGATLPGLKLRAQLLLTCGSSHSEKDHIYTDSIVSSLHYCGISDVDIQVKGDVHENLNAERRKSLMEKAYGAGIQFAENLKQG
ncbi:MAG: NAD(P)H-dependent oxidoreductase [Gammaproteobacteria bacterium]|nr:NAD(P)H-dependent oxidoreductase [Gammaproteobacteria bacterium]MDH5692612.1 NAD(P)H-dependent oxidoreductase [Gammaproteobacteria bacterium]